MYRYTGYTATRLLSVILKCMTLDLFHVKFWLGIPCEIEGGAENAGRENDGPNDRHSHEKAGGNHRLYDTLRFNATGPTRSGSHDLECP